MKLRSVFSCLLITLSMNVMATENKDSLVSFVQNARSYVVKNGFESACKEFNKGPSEKGMFQRGELFIFAYDYEGKVLCHGARKEAVGSNYLNLKDLNGRPFIKELMDASKEKEGGFVRFKWKNPALNNLIENKLSFSLQVDSRVWIGAGISL